METTTKVPAITAGNIRKDENITKAVGAYDQAEKKANTTKSDSALFCYAVEMFRDDVTRQDIIKDHGMKAPAMTKASKVVRYIIDRDIPTDETFTVDRYNDVADTIRAEFGNIFAAYRTLWPTERIEKTLAEKLAALYKESGMNAETFGLYATGVAESVDAGGDDDEEDADQ